VFKDSPTATTYTAKVIDFGYSSRFTHEEDTILMPKSVPWHAPEHRSSCKPAQGQKMDVFSFGMLCLWTIFEKHLSRVLELPPEAHWAQQHLPMKNEKNVDLKFLSELKRQKQLAFLAEALITCESGIPDKSKGPLRDFFRASLQPMAKNRAADIEQCLGFSAIGP
jgi:serine/threonine protein kinase